MFKKVLAITLMMAMCLSLVACGSKQEDAANNSSDGASSATVEDLAKIKEKGNIVIGITDFEPMDYKDADGNWVGFDADMAEAFAKSLGVEAKFVEIEWDNKALELES